MIERHYTINEVTEVLSMSFEKARQLVMHEPGVVRFAPPKKNGKPAARTMYRIPESVLQRILRRNANV